MYYSLNMYLVLISPPWFCKTFVYDFHQGVEGDPHFTLVDELSLK
jgi:hypothetical protein